MYVVISKWSFLPSDEAAVTDSAAKMMAEIRGWRGVEEAFNVRAGDDYVLAVITYSDRTSYERLIQDPEGPFERAAAEHGIEQKARWEWSERGERLN